jgi:hypothetical protein
MAELNANQPGCGSPCLYRGGRRGTDLSARGAADPASQNAARWAIRPRASLPGWRCVRPAEAKSLDFAYSAFRIEPRPLPVNKRAAAEIRRRLPANPLHPDPSSPPPPPPPRPSARLLDPLFRQPAGRRAPAQSTRSPTACGDGATCPRIDSGEVNIGRAPGPGWRAP